MVGPILPVSSYLQWFHRIDSDISVTVSQSVFKAAMWLNSKCVQINSVISIHERFWQLGPFRCSRNTIKQHQLKKAYLDYYVTDCQLESAYKDVPRRASSIALP